MPNLTDPQLAPLVARYRAWVEKQNMPPSKPKNRATGQLLYSVNRQVPTYFGFLDWAIREGIEVPKGGA